MQDQAIFISYSRSDSDFAMKLANDLREAGINVWLDQLDINTGERWDRSIQSALRECPRLLIILSPDSMNSDSVMDEVSYALQEEKQMIPILFRECDIDFRLRRLQHIDFIMDYGLGFTKLLALLNQEEAITKVEGEKEAQLKVQQKKASKKSEQEAVESKNKVEQQLNNELPKPLSINMKGKGKIGYSLSVFSNKKIRLLWIPFIFIFCTSIMYLVYQGWFTDFFSARKPPPRGLIFATKIEANGQAIDPNTTFSQNITDLYAVFPTSMAPPGMKVNVEIPKEGAYYSHLKVIDETSLSSFGWRWYRDGKEVNYYEMSTKSGKKNFWLKYSDYESPGGIFNGKFSPGTYTIVILLDGNPAMSAELKIVPKS